jgi:glycosyltransferase involved in cell wall biosynthesis
MSADPDHTDADRTDVVPAPSIDLILPVLNEAGALPWVLERIPAGVRAIVVDNASTDGSGDVARSFGATVVDEPQRGFGSACWAGLQRADADIVCFMDADATLDPGEIPNLVQPLLDDRLDLVLGRRQPEKGSWPAHARLANAVLAASLRRRGIPLHDLGPLRAARRVALLELHLVDRASGWPLEMVLRARHAEWRIGEVPVAYRPRVGESKVTGSLRGSLRVAKEMRHYLRTLPR